MSWRRCRKNKQPRLQDRNTVGGRIRNDQINLEMLQGDGVRRQKMRQRVDAAMATATALDAAALPVPRRCDMMLMAGLHLHSLMCRITGRTGHGRLR